ncbi:hypothetical protein FB566_1181 [Stackebrandtia endophytica]|uniref:Uncharacterized protein n=1 Tax=Stackebrandtia endophytica TaxID=1496996 RepID=A0A543ASW2_9ACTN|nr:hypothetical protein FB566_1181 [Stackebrandtia endophytica]
MYRHDAPHGTATSSIPTSTKSKPRIMTITRQITTNGSEKMHLIHEALARARMREVWRGEHRHRRRSAREILIAARRAERDSRH